MKSLLFKCSLALLAVLSAAVCSGSAPAPGPRLQMLVGAWNYKPDYSVTPVRGITRAVFRYGHPAGDFNWDAVYIEFTVDGRVVRDERAVARLRELPVLDWVNVYWWKTFHDKPPRNFCQESIDVTKRKVAEIRERLVRCGMTDRELEGFHHVLDFENWDTTPVPGMTGGWEGPYGFNACYLFTNALRDGGWTIGENGGAANYNTNHSGTITVMGGEPHNMLTPAQVPGSLDGRTTFVSGYHTGGPRGCRPESELMDALEKAPAPIWLALEDNNPGLMRILRRAKASGKVKLILLWGNGIGENNETGDNHREKRRGGSVDWMRTQDERIARALGY